MHRPTRNILTGLYEVEERGITYAFPFELLESFKTYYNRWGKGYEYATVCENWFKDQPKENKKLIKRIGLEPDAGDIFYPDE